MLVVKLIEVVEVEPLELEEAEGVCFSAYCSYDISNNKTAGDVPIPTPTFGNLGSAPLIENNVKVRKVPLL
jgi:hypothetical protein